MIRGDGRAKPLRSASDAKRVKLIVFELDLVTDHRQLPIDGIVGSLVFRSFANNAISLDGIG